MGVTAAMLPTLQASAQDTMTALVLECTDGTATTFLLNESPVLTISDNILTARSVKQEVSIDVENLIDYHFTQVPADIKDKFSENNLSFRNGMVLFSNLKEGEHVDIYTIDGRKLDTRTALADGYLEINLSLYEHGIIIIHTLGGSYKINNK